MIMIKGSVHQEDNNNCKHVLNIEVPKYIKLKRKIINNTVVVVELIPHSQQRANHTDRESTWNSEF